jgi:hypothetical protein
MEAAMALLRKLVATVGALGSFVALLVQLKAPSEPFSAGQVALIVIAIGLLVVAMVLDVQEYFSSRPIRYKSGPDQQRKIRDYLFRWISNGGTVAVFSNNLGWVDDDAMREMLYRKAQRSELILILPKSIPLSDDLKDRGAEVVTYPSINYVIRSRFTIVNFNRIDTAVAIGRMISRDHVIEEFNAGSHPAFFLAQDLVEILRRSHGEIA